MTLKISWISIVMCGLLGLPMALQAESSAEDLARESEAACAASAANKPTPQIIIAKVDAAVALIEKDGAKAFPKFKGKDSEFLFGGTYIWVNDYDGVMLMHPVKNKMERQNYIGLQDKNGKKLFVEMIDVARNKGAGWVDYIWPKPGDKTPVLKVSYVKKAKCDGKDVVVGCGVYDMTLAEIQKATGGK